MRRYFVMLVLALMLITVYAGTGPADEMEKPAAIVMESAEGVPLTRVFYTYNDEGQYTLVLQESSPDGGLTWQPSERYRYIYTEKKREIYHEKTDDAGETWANLIVETDLYNDDGQRVTEITEYFQPDGSSTVETITNIYDDSGRRITRDRHNVLADGFEFRSRQIYEYDDAGNVIQTLDESFVNDEWRATGKMVAEYDDRNRVTAEYNYSRTESGDYLLNNREIFTYSQDGTVRETSRNVRSVTVGSGSGTAARRIFQMAGHSLLPGQDTKTVKYMKGAGQNGFTKTAT